MKKGMLSIILLAVFFFVVMGVMFAKFQIKKSSFDLTVGESQLDLLKTYTRGEQILYYVDKSANLAVTDAIIELGEIGGFTEPVCGNYHGHPLWQTEDKPLRDCKPAISKSFTEVINTKLNTYLNEPIYDVLVYTDNYQYSLDEGGILGVAKRHVLMDIKCGSVICGEYRINPSFSVRGGFDLDYFNEIEEKFLLITEECSNTQDLIGDAQLRNCVNLQAKGTGWSRTLLNEELIRGTEDRHFAFTYETEIGGTPVAHKAALFVPDKIAPPAIKGIQGYIEDGSLIVSFDESVALDVEHYIVYYAPAPQVLDPSDLLSSNVDELEVDYGSVSIDVSGGDYYIGVVGVDENGFSIKEDVEGVLISTPVV